MDILPDLGDTLLAHARFAIGREFDVATNVAPVHPALSAPSATFVTLRKQGALRGCIGTVDAWRPLGEDVRANAVAAAFNDPRFPPLRPDEYDDLAVEVSLLSASVPLRVRDEADALAQLVPGVDGVILTSGRRRATFLPQVWEQLPDARTFLGELKRKAGLPYDYWGPEIALARYRVDKFAEKAAAEAR